MTGSWTVPPSRLDPGTAYSWPVTVRDPAGATAQASSRLVVAMLPTADDVVSTSTGGGYWQVDTYGGVFAFGDAGFYGSMAGRPLNGHITGMSVTPTAKGYLLNGCDGGIFAFGDAVFRGSNPTYQCRGA